MRVLLGITAIILAASGCSGSDAADEPQAAPSTATAARSLHDTCPLLERATPTGLLPSEARLTTYSARLDELASEGDAETQNAVAFLQSATDNLMHADQGSESADAFAQMTAALRTAGDRCRAVGSSSFQ